MSNTRVSDSESYSYAFLINGKLKLRDEFISKSSLVESDFKGIHFKLNNDYWVNNIHMTIMDLGSHTKLHELISDNKVKNKIHIEMGKILSKIPTQMKADKIVHFGRHIALQIVQTHELMSSQLEFKKYLTHTYYLNIEKNYSFIPHITFGAVNEFIYDQDIKQLNDYFKPNEYIELETIVMSRRCGSGYRAKTETLFSFDLKECEARRKREDKRIYKILSQYQPTFFSQLELEHQYKADRLEHALERFDKARKNLIPSMWEQYMGYMKIAYLEKMAIIFSIFLPLTISMLSASISITVKATLKKGMINDNHGVFETITALGELLNDTFNNTEIIDATRDLLNSLNPLENSVLVNQRPCSLL